MLTFAVLGIGALAFYLFTKNKSGTPGAPVLDSITPNPFSYSSGTTVVVKGSGFGTTPLMGITYQGQTGYVPYSSPDGVTINVAPVTLPAFNLPATVQVFIVNLSNVVGATASNVVNWTLTA